MNGTIFSIKRYTIHDGPGIRITVFFKGCPMRCWWCHNPEGIAPQVQPMPRLDRDGNPVNDLETVGMGVSVDEIMTEIRKELIFFEESGGGVTFSGGEPMSQPQFLDALLSRCRAIEIPTTVDTCGFAPAKDYDMIRDKVNLFLYDLKLFDDAEHIKYTGVSNKLVFENLRRLLEHRCQVIARIPIIPGITDTPHNIEGLITLISGMPGLRKVALLPYHQAGDAKYRRLGLENKMNGVRPPATEQLESIAAQFARNSITTTIGG